MVIACRLASRYPRNTFLCYPSLPQGASRALWPGCNSRTLLPSPVNYRESLLAGIRGRKHESQKPAPNKSLFQVFDDTEC
eukprot:1818769-Amphidinium_carterae.1